MQHKFKTPIYLEDIDGRARALKGCSLNNLPKLANLLILVSDRLSESKYETVGDLWVNDVFWRDITTEVLRLVGLQPEWFSPSMLAELLFASENSDGLSQGGVIQMACFPRSAGVGGEELVSLEEYRLQQLSNLVAGNLSNSLSDALAIADALSLDEIAHLVDTVREAQEKADPAKQQVAGSQALAEELANNPSLLFGTPKTEGDLIKSLAT